MIEREDGFGYQALTEFAENSDASRICVAKSPGLLRLCVRGIVCLVQRIKAVVALVLALVWLPAVSCCLMDASGLVSKQDCCSKKHSSSVPGPVNCDKPCGNLAAANYFPQLGKPTLVAPVGLLLFDCAEFLADIQRFSGVRHDLPATAPPELAGH